MMAKKPKDSTNTTENLEAAAALISKLDRSEIGEKIRLYTLAKKIGLASKELVAQFAELDIKKAPQSSVTAEEADKVLNHIVEADEKLRDRVRKNVANEIHQIEEKVEKEVEERREEEEDDKSSSEESADSSADDADDDDEQDEPEVEQDLGTMDIEKLHEALVEAGDDFEEDDAPVVTPMPEDEPEVYDFAPLFKAPTPQPKRETESGKGRRRGSRGTSRGRGAEAETDTEQQDDVEKIEEPKAVRGSTRIEAQRRRRSEMREKGHQRKHLVSQAEFLARRESVERTMVVRDKKRNDGGGWITQVGVLEDDLLVEHFVTTESQASIIGNIYLGRVQNVLPSMEAAFIDIGTGRNGVLYAGEVDWRAAGLGGRSRRIEQALKAGDQVLVQVTKDPLGHKGARLSTQISLAGRYLVYVPGGRSAGISRKLPVPERKRLKDILERVVSDKGGAIIRTAAENVAEEAIASDVNRLQLQWDAITQRAEQEKSSKGAKPVTLYEEPDLLVKVVRDLFNEDFSHLVVDGRRSFNTVRAYVDSMAPDLADRVVEYQRNEHGGQDAFENYRIDEQLHKALSRKVWLPSGGTLIIERTEAMTVIDVNTGKFTGSGGNLEETVTKNNLEAAEEIVRQMRLRDLGGMIVVDFIDMVLPENQELVLRRLKEALGRDRTRHQVSEVTSLGLVQMTRKRLGTGLLESFATECEHCHGRGLIVHEYPVDEEPEHDHDNRKSRRSKKKNQDPAGHPAAKAMHRHEDAEDEKQGAQNKSEHDKADNADKGDKKKSKKDSDAELEELVANVVIEETPASRRRRRRKASSKGSRKEQKQQHDDKPSKKGDKPEKKAERKSERKADSKAEKPEQKQTYEEAVAEFEASPRRKRKTRGNSRSDHRPQRSDFEDAPQQQAEDVAAEKQEKRTEMQVQRTSRKRRRAVRRTTKPKMEAAKVEASQQDAKQEDTKPKADKRQSDKKETGKPKVTVRNSHGRRRAVRKTVRRQADSHDAAPKQQVKQQSAEAEQKPKADAKSSGSKPSRGRGRRRVTRRGRK